MFYSTLYAFHINVVLPRNKMFDVHLDRPCQVHHDGSINFLVILFGNLRESLCKVFQTALVFLKELQFSGTVYHEVCRNIRKLEDAATLHKLVMRRLERLPMKGCVQFSARKKMMLYVSESSIRYETIHRSYSLLVFLFQYKLVTCFFGKLVALRMILVPLKTVQVSFQF